MDELFSRPTHYILDGDTPVPVDVRTWARWCEKANRIVAQHEVSNPQHPTQLILISTIFLGLDMNWGPTGPPLLWETMILRASGWDFDEYQERYSSADEARAGHQEALRLVEAKTGTPVRAAKGVSHGEPQAQPHHNGKSAHDRR